MYFALMVIYESIWNRLLKILIINIVGNCVTGVGSDQVCGLNSMSTGCSLDDKLSTIDCLCYSGVNVSEADNCESKNLLYIHI